MAVLSSTSLFTALEYCRVALGVGTEGENRKGILFGGEDLRVTRVSLRSEISATICVYQGETSSRSSAPDTAAVGAGGTPRGEEEEIHSGLC